MLEPTVETISIQKGDIVEIIAEPFKKEKAKVLRIDKQKGEVVVSLLAAVVPMPVTIKIDNIKVIRREEGEDETSQTTSSESASELNKSSGEDELIPHEDDDFEN